mgnify:CR=1 FL=1
MDVVKNIKEIRLNKGIKQEVIADALNVDTAVISNIEKGKRELKVSELEKIANSLGEDVLYLFTYPKRFVEESIAIDKEPLEAVLQIKLRKDKRDQVLKIVFGDNNLEILSK